MRAARGELDRFVRMAMLGVVAGVVAYVGAPPGSGSATPALTGVDLSTYVRVGRFDLPEPTRTTPPANSLLAQEASSVAYDWDTDTLFVVGDGGTSVVQVTKTGQLVDSMTLAPGDSPQGTTFFDTEGITYVGNGKFVLVEERDRQLNLFSYVAGGTLTRGAVQTVKLGTTIGNIGIEGVSNDPLSGGFLYVKEQQPEGICQTGIDFAAGTATNGSPTAVNCANLFDPALTGLNDFSDVYSLSNLPTLTGPDATHFLVISQESGKVENLSRTGAVSSTLTIQSDPGNPLTVPQQTDEGVTMDNAGNLYIVNEQGGGDVNHPQLWVYQPSSAPNQAPTAITLDNKVSALPENTSTATRLKVADVAITDDGIGTNNLTVTGPDAAFFEVDNTGLYIKAGTVLDFETKNSYSITVNVDDPNVGTTPDASTPYTLTLTDVVNEDPGNPTVVVSEVCPWCSGNAPYMADWWELTNTGANPMNITGWKMDDDSSTLNNAVALNGVTTIPAGQSAVFVEGTAATATALKSAWFGTNVPLGLQIGTYSGSGVGLGTGGDQVNVFDTLGNRVTGVRFGTATTGFTFDNAAGIGGTTSPPPPISTLSVAGTNGAFLASDGTETGSPGTTRQVTISEVCSWCSGNSPYMADFWEITNASAGPVSAAGWKMDDDSNTLTNAVALNGVTTIPAGQSAVFTEGNASTASALAAAWFGTHVPANFRIGTYSGSGVGLGTGGDQVNLFDSAGNRVTGVRFGTATTGFTLDNKAGIGGITSPPPAISTLSVAGTNGAFLGADAIETGSPGRTFADTAPPVIAIANTPDGLNGWNVGDPVLATVTASDAFTGLAATPACTDNGSPLTLTATVAGTWTAPLGADGSHAVECSVNDVAGNPASASATVKRDSTAPSTTISVPTADGLNGWYLSGPTVTLSGADTTSGLASTHYTLDGVLATYSAPFAVSTAGMHTLQEWSTDNAGNVESQQARTIKVDLTAPTSTAALTPAAQNGWFASPTLTLTGSDPGESGIDRIVYSLDGGADQTYTGPVSGFTTGSHFVQFHAVDVAGRVESTHLLAFKADAGKPSVNVTKPADGAVYPLDKVVGAAFKCTDDESGIATCAGTVAPGASIDTSSVGSHAFTVTATDKAGNVTTKTVHYTVVYTFNGFFGPISNEADSALNLVHAGDLVKIGFGLNGDRGLSIGTFSSAPIACPAWAPHTIPAAGAGSTADLSFGVSSGHYTFGFPTQTDWAGTCRRFSLALNDGTPAHTAVFMFFA